MLTVPMGHEDGMKVERTRGTPQGGANLFLHYAFDLWVARAYPDLLTFRGVGTQTTGWYAAGPNKKRKGW